MPEESHKYSVRKVFRSFDRGGSVLDGWGVPHLYTSSGCYGVVGLVDQIAELWVIVRWCDKVGQRSPSLLARSVTTLVLAP